MMYTYLKGKTYESYFWKKNVFKLSKSLLNILNIEGHFADDTTKNDCGVFALEIARNLLHDENAINFTEIRNAINQKNKNVQP